MSWYLIPATVVLAAVIVFVILPVLLLELGYRRISVAYMVCSLALILNACSPSFLRMRLAGPIVRDIILKLPAS